MVEAAQLVSPGSILQVGHLLKGRYLVEEVLQVSSVNLYRATMDKEPVLVKEKSLPTPEGEGEETVEEPRHEPSTSGSFKSEFELLNVVGSSTLQRAHEHFFEGGMEYLILEWPSGEKLADVVFEKEILDEDFALEVAIQLCKAVSLLHQHGYAHLDIEPGNVLLEGDTVRLFSFGRTVQLGSTDRQYLTTDGYSAPELFMNKETVADQRADVYSLGAILYTLLTGKVLPATGATPDILTHTLNPDLARTLLGTLTPRIESRCESADDFKQRLLDYRARPKPSLRFDTALISDVGMVRRDNEDCGWAADVNGYRESQWISYGLYLVADGMGGEQAGEVASGKAVDTICQTISNTLDSGATVDNPNALGKESIEKASKEIYLLARDNPALSSMGTTATLGLRIENNLFLGHVGDSRAYLIRGGDIEQLTEDHSLVTSLVKAGLIKPEEARTHPDRGKIYRSLGNSPTLFVDKLKEEKLLLQGGDVLLFCTDGLVNYVTDKELLSEVKAGNTALCVCQRLVRLANERGGDDNVTVVAVKVSG